MKVAIITGGSSGIGKATAKHFAKKGYKVYEFSRKGVSSDIVTHVTCDVTDEKSCIDAINTVVNTEGRIDIVVNNAGFGISGAIEHTETFDAKRLFDVNFFGVHNITKNVLTYLKSSKGRLVNVSSVGGELSLPFQAFYSATKSAIDAYTLALRNEVKNYGVTVTAVLPGDVKTGFTANREKSTVGSSEYNGRIERSVAGMEKDETNGYTPELIAGKIYKIATKKRVKPMYTLGFKYKVLMVLAKFLPKSLVNRVIYMLYAK